MFNHMLMLEYLCFINILNADDIYSSGYLTAYTLSLAMNRLMYC